MVLSTKNINILGVPWKIWGGGGSRKANIENYCLKKEAWTVSWFKGGLGKKEGVVFLREFDILMHTTSSRDKH